jgi:hypothetical protein
MKITIELDPTTAAVQTISPAPPGGMAIPRAAEPAAESAGLDAGACAGLPPEQPISPAAPQRGSTGIAPAVGPPPRPHPDTFGLTSSAAPHGNGQDAGPAKS